MNFPAFLSSELLADKAYWHNFFSLFIKVSMKVITLFIPALFALLLLLSCRNTKPRDQVQTDEQDVFLISNLYQESLLSLRLAEEALTRSTYIETKNLANNVKSSQATIKIDIESFAGRKGIDLPLDITAKQLNGWRELVRNKGVDFDKKFLQILTNSNTSEHQTIEKITTSAKDPDLRKTGKELFSVIISKKEMANQVKQLNNLRTKDSLAYPVSFDSLSK